MGVQLGSDVVPLVALTTIPENVGGNDACANAVSHPRIDHNLWLELANEGIPADPSPKTPHEFSLIRVCAQGRLDVTPKPKVVAYLSHVVLSDINSHRTYGGYGRGHCRAVSRSDEVVEIRVLSPRQCPAPCLVDLIYVVKPCTPVAL